MDDGERRHRSVVPGEDQLELTVLFSAGKDSALTALLLEPFYDVTLLTVHFGLTDSHEHARASANALGFPFEPLELGPAIAVEAVQTLCEDGYPRNAVQSVHEAALEAVSETAVDAVADGTRRDDRVPTISRAGAQSLEDRHDIQYLAPLRGFSRRAVDQLAAQTLEVESGPSEAIGHADYEAALRSLLRAEHGTAAVETIFPDHVQSVVRGPRR